jgi:tetrahydromethanopterin S-methyltransferase subunit G|tara:strand:+ start:487 stop:684 length:198 start_codon:yes stop_codon:yes gene_type:complete
MEEEVMDMDSEQNLRLREVESRMNSIESDMAAIIARLDTLSSIGKALAILAGTAIGIDIMPLLGA